MQTKRALSPPTKKELTTLDRFVDGDRQSWFDAWCDAAATLADQGREAAGRGHARTAR